MHARRTVLDLYVRRNVATGGELGMTVHVIPGAAYSRYLGAALSSHSTLRLFYEAFSGSYASTISSYDYDTASAAPFGTLPTPTALTAFATRAGSSGANAFGPKRVLAASAAKIWFLEEGVATDAWLCSAHGNWGNCATTYAGSKVHSYTIAGGTWSEGVLDLRPASGSWSHFVCGSMGMDGSFYYLKRGVLPSSGKYGDLYGKVSAAGNVAAEQESPVMGSPCIPMLHFA